MNATRLRAELYAVLDEIVQTGEPVMIERKGHRLMLSLERRQAPAKKKNWPTLHPEWVNGDSDDLVDVDWSKEWRP